MKEKMWFSFSFCVYKKKIVSLTCGGSSWPTLHSWWLFFFLLISGEFLNTGSMTKWSWTDVTVTSGFSSPRSGFPSSSSPYSLLPAGGEHMLRVCSGRVWKQFPTLIPGGWIRKEKWVRAPGRVASSDTDDLGFDCTEQLPNMPQHASALSR